MADMSTEDLLALDDDEILELLAREQAEGTSTASMDALPTELIMASCVPARAPMVLGSAAQGCMRSLKGWISSVESINRTNSGMFGGSDSMAKSNACMSPLLRDVHVILAEAC